MPVSSFGEHDRLPDLGGKEGRSEEREVRKIDGAAHEAIVALVAERRRAERRCSAFELGARDEDRELAPGDDEAGLARYRIGAAHEDLDHLDAEALAWLVEELEPLVGP